MNTDGPDLTGGWQAALKWEIIQPPDVADDQTIYRVFLNATFIARLEMEI
jgi:hypothetical protein